MNRRRALVGFFAVACTSVACSKRSRCATCGMVVDPSSSFYAEIVRGDATTRFDTPRCALRAYLSAPESDRGSLFVQEYYDRSRKDARSVRFVVGGDVVGPMGPDLVPVEPSRVSKFIQDHAADRAFRLDELTPELVLHPVAK